MDKVLTFIYFITFIIYIFLGFRVIALNYKKKLNRILSIASISFSIWALGLVYMMSASTLEEALLWQKISVAGWGFCYGFNLHIALLITKNKVVEKHPWIIQGIYIPSIVIVISYGLLNRTFSFQNQLFMTYYLLYSVLTIGIVFVKSLNIVNKYRKRRAIVLILSYIVAVVLGILFDSGVSQQINYSPSYAPIILLIPIICIYYYMDHYKLLVHHNRETNEVSYSVLDISNRIQLIRFVSFSFLVGSIITISVFLYDSERISDGLTLGTYMVVLAAIVFNVPDIIDSIKKQEFIILLSMITMIPLAYRTYDNAISNVGWIVPILIIMITIVFHNKYMTIAVAIIGALIGIIFGTFMGEYAITLNWIVYGMRLIAYGLGIGIAYFLKIIYTKRLRDNERQIIFQKMISELSTKFINLKRANFDELIMELLDKSGLVLKADYCYYSIYSKYSSTFQILYKWHKTGNDNDYSVKGKITNFNWLTQELLNNNIVYIPSLRSLPDEAVNELEFMEINCIKAMLIIPIIHNEEIVGLIIYNFNHHTHHLAIDDYDLLKILGNIVSNGIKKIENEDYINRLAYFDKLTGLPNRVMIENRINKEIKKAVSNNKQVGVIFIDLDGFKNINDTLGHEWGDYVLKEISNRLTDIIKHNGIVGRFGGDEFLIVIPEIESSSKIEGVINRIIESFNQSLKIEYQDFFISSSIGVAIYPIDGSKAGTLIQNADLAMYHSKNNGKNRYTFCSEALKQEVHDRTYLTNQLYRAIQRNELELYYQPKVSLETMELIGCEALIRWIHPLLGVISPGVFIPIAEQTGLINEIGEWVVYTACKQSRYWERVDSKAANISINLSIEQFKSGNLKGIIQECFVRNQINPSHIIFEITESTAMLKSEYISKALQELKELGVQLSIDDFGKEYSSLSRLKELPFDIIKIDMGFVRGISKNRKDEIIIEEMIYLASKMGMKVVAEGIETEIQNEFLRNAVCDIGQGYYFSKPLPKEAFESKYIH